MRTYVHELKVGDWITRYEIRFQVTRIDQNSVDPSYVSVQLTAQNGSTTTATLYGEAKLEAYGFAVDDDSENT